MTDPELQELFTDPADREVVELLKTSRPAVPPLDRHFRNYLRTQLMAEARRTLPQRERAPWFGLRLPSPPLAMAAVAAGFLIVLGLEIAMLQRNGGPQPVAANINLVNNKSDISTAEPIKIPFSGPVDKAAVEQTVQIEPATNYTTRWDGSTLVIVPTHPLAANTGYTVTLKPAAAPQPSQPAPAKVQPPVVVHFVTAAPPPAPVVPPTYTVANLQYLGDRPIADPGTVGQAVWTPDGQLLVTRPAAASQSASATASVNPTSASGTEIWLMSPKGSFLRRLATGTYPAAAPAGGLFAFWQTDANRAALEFGPLDASSQPATLATIDGAPDRAPVWLGSGRLAYLDAGKLRVVDLRGTPSQTPEVSVSGSLAASPDGALLAVETREGVLVFDLRTGKASPALPAGATSLAWSRTNDLAFVTGQAGNQQLFVAHGGTAPASIYSAPINRTWTDVSWSPDGHSLLFASQPAAGAVEDFTHAYLINADGTGGPSSFGSGGAEYGGPRWSPDGTSVLFSRRDEAGGSRLWVASVKVEALSPLDTAQRDALSEVKTFMDARLRGDMNAALNELGPAAQAQYQNGGLTLASPSGLHFARQYVVSVQVVDTNNVLVGVRLVLADQSNRETSYFEESLTVKRHDQKFLIDSIDAKPPVQIGKGPTVVSVQVQRNKPGQLVLVQFDSDLDPASVSAATLYVRDAEGPVRAEVSFDKAAHLVTLNVKLKPGTYTLVVTTSVTDIKGQGLGQQYESKIQVGETAD